MNGWTRLDTASDWATYKVTTADRLQVEAQGGGDLDAQQLSDLFLYRGLARLVGRREVDLGREAPVVVAGRVVEGRSLRDGVLADVEEPRSRARGYDGQHLARPRIELHQLAALRRTGLVAQQRREGQVFYAITAPEIRDLLLAARTILLDVIDDQAGLRKELRASRGAAS